MLLILLLPDLERGASYQIRIQALNVNGSGPPTDLMTSVTYAYDLDGMHNKLYLHIGLCLIFGKTHLKGNIIETLLWISTGLVFRAHGAMACTSFVIV